jgi:hypothetical protein
MQIHPWWLKGGYQGHQWLTNLFTLYPGKAGECAAKLYDASMAQNYVLHPLMILHRPCAFIHANRT